MASFITDDQIRAEIDRQLAEGEEEVDSDDENKKNLENDYSVQEEFDVSTKDRREFLF